MKTIRLYYPASYQANTSIQLSDDAFHHAFKVLRCKKNDRLELFDGKGSQANAEVETIERRTATIKIHDVTIVNRESPLKITLIQGVSKGERMDFVMQKATELGVSEIQPIITERCNVQLDSTRWEKRQLHWQKIIISACEQSARNCIPKLLPVITLDELLNKALQEQVFALHPSQQQTIKDLAIDKNKELFFMVGPEGGFSENEINLCLENSIKTIGLGPRILRTETAAVSVLSIAQALWGDI